MLREPRGDYQNIFIFSVLVCGGRDKCMKIFYFGFERKTYYVVPSTGIETWLKVFLLVQHFEYDR